jgi:hypothetical protein
LKALRHPIEAKAKGDVDIATHAKYCKTCKHLHPERIDERHDCLEHKMIVNESDPACDKYTQAIPLNVALQLFGMHPQVPESCGNCIGRFDSSKCRPAVTEGACANKDEYRPKVPDAEPWINVIKRIGYGTDEQLAIKQLQQRFDALQREMREVK